MDKQEKILTQGIKFIVRDNGSKNEFEEGFTNHVPFISDVNEIQVRLFRESVQAENDHGADFEIIREDIGFITSKNRFVDAKEAMEIAIEQDQILEINNCFAEFHEAQLAENFRKVNALLGELQSLKLKHASRELKPEDLY